MVAREVERGEQEMSHLLIRANSLRIPLADSSVQCVITSPPYWGLRDYGVDGQLGLESTPDAFVADMVAVFAEVWRVLRDDGTCFMNLGDSYNAYNGGAGPSSSISNGAATTERPALPTGYGLRTKGLKPKDLIGIPWRTALALQADGWYLRSDIIWAKPNPMPESVTDRPTKSHEYVFLLTKSERYYWDAEAVRESSPVVTPRQCGNKNAEARLVERLTGNMRPGVTWESEGGRNLRTVWTIPSEPFTDVYADGMSRITSPDCPVHGYPASRGIVQRCDEQQAVSQSGHNQHTESDRVQGPSIAESSMSQDQSGFPWETSVAKPRSKRSRKKAIALEPDATCADTPASHTPCMEPQSHCNATSDHKPECNTAGGDASDGLPLDPSERTQPHNECIDTSEILQLRCSCNYIDARPLIKRTSQRFRSVLSISTEAYPGSHFATFARKLVEPCVKAGTSQKGCCPECGKPWVRVVESERVATRPGNGSKVWSDNSDDPHSMQNGSVIGNRDPFRHVSTKTTTGWKAQCAHDLAPVPCLVFDPFTGSGTTGVVAEGLHRNFVGIDLSREYLGMARRRIERPHQPIPRPGRVESFPLFGE